MIDTATAGRYARALFIATERRNETVRALEDLKGTAEVLQADTPAGGFFLSPEIRLADKREALRKAFGGRALPIVVVFIDLLLRKKPVRALEDLVERALGVRRAHVVSAVPLTPSEVGLLLPELERITGGKIKLTTEIDPDVLGGVLVRIGDRVIDRTVRALLQAISRQLYEASV
jgi:F-type H+-transporting ATPase subunit delta